ncbi:MAG: O-antigen ligase family protein [Thermoleophilia bacterium]
MILATVALMLIEGFGIFFNGAYFLGPLTLGVVGSWLIFSAAALLEPDAFLRQSKWARLAAALLAAFWLWTGISITWSISAELTWNEFNRTGGYLAVFLIGLAVARHPQVRNFAAGLFLAVAAAAICYSLGPKLFPASVDNLNDLARISIPIGYANAQGLLAALALVPAVFFAARRGTHWVFRLLAAAGAPVILVALFFTISRGATLAVAIGLVAYFILSPLRLRSLAVIALAGVPAGLICFWSSSQDALMHDSQPMASRLAAAATLRLDIVFAVAAAALLFAAALAVGKRFSLSRLAGRILGATILTALTVAVIFSASLFIASKPSFSGWVRQTWEDFTTVRGTEAGAGRLLQVNSLVRWNLWNEAFSNWKLHPVTGSGAQSFPLTHLMIRQPGMPFVKQAHSMPFSLLSELGLVGFVLMGAFIWLTLGLGIRNLARTSDRWQRGLAAALMAFLVTYLIHASYDWDWNMFALTLPYFFFAGILTGWRPAAAIEEARPAAAEGTRAAAAGAAETPVSVRPSAPAERRDKGKHYRRRATAR